MKDVIYQQLTKRCFVADVEKNLAEEGRGYGLFAKSAFRSGDVIFEEYPIGTTAVVVLTVSDRLVKTRSGSHALTAVTRFIAP
jgi:hypothetical protein